MQEQEYPQIVIPHRIKNSFIREHQNYIFIYGYDVAEKGALGQVVECVGEPNCLPVWTRWKGCKSSGYFQDSQFSEIKNGIDICIDGIKILANTKPNMPIIPFPKIGEGASRMKELAPKCFKYLTERLNLIKYPNIKIDYNA